MCPRTTSGGGSTARAASELVIVAVGLLLYNAGRVAVEDQEALARTNAERIHRWQQDISFPSEAAIQDVFASTPRVFELANVYYVTLHFPAVMALLVWSFLARPHHEYAWARNLLAAITFLALAIHVAFPLAPPRMFPEWGFRDTMTTWGPSAYDGARGDVANQFAAMPSLHVGWALLVAVVVHKIGSATATALAWCHAVVTAAVVVLTANDWWIDGLVAAALLGLALAVLPEPGTNRFSAARGRRGASAGRGRPRPGRARCRWSRTDH